jgi:hypothetical protein
LVGPFGGYGGYTEQRFDAKSYEISTVVAGKAATEIRAIVYASGCELQEFVIPLTQESHVSQEFTCQPAQTVELSGQIVPNELARYANAELVIKYTAAWTHSFFGIADGPVTQFQLARVRPQSDGRFEINLPVVERETAHLAQSSLCLMLRDSHTFNPIAFNLEPDEADLRSGYRCLQARAFYPANITFTAAHFEKSALRGKVFRSDTGEPISDSYILLVREGGQPTNFDTRTDEAGDYIFGPVPAGHYTVSIYAWFPKREEVPCHNPPKQKSTDGGDITIEWQWKSHAFMEIVTLKGFSVESEQENVKDFDVLGH